MNSVKLLYMKSKLILACLTVVLVGCGQQETPPTAKSSPGGPKPLVESTGETSTKSSGMETVTVAKWHDNLDDAMKEAKASGKMIMIDFNASWCPPCKQMKEEVFPSAAFQNAAKDFVLVDIDTDKQGELAAKYGASSIPDFRFLTSDGKEVHQVVGSRPVNEFVAEMEKATSKQ